MPERKIFGFNITQLVSLGSVIGLIFGITLYFGNKWVDSTETHVKDVGQRVERVDDRVEHLAGKVAQIDREVGEVKQGVNALDKRADGVDKRLEANTQQGTAILDELRKL